MSSTSNYHKVCALILFFISLSLAFRDHLYENHKLQTRSQRYYCGNNLIRALQFLCETYNKRSIRNTLSQDMSGVENEVISSDDDIEASKYSLLLNDNNRFHRHVRGVVDECCRRSCSTSQLSQYCGVIRVTTTAAPIIE